MTRIAARAPNVAVLDVYSVEPEAQDRVLGALTTIAETVANRLPGFLNANLHRSVDGKRVMNYAQWQTRADAEMMLAIAAQMPETAQLGERDSHVYELAHMESATPEAGIDPAVARLTNIVVMTCTPDEQDELVRYLIGIAQEHSAHDGFGLCAIHRSFDGTRVAEYIQWRDRAALGAMIAMPSSQLHFARVRHRSSSSVCDAVATIAPFGSDSARPPETHAYGRLD